MWQKVGSLFYTSKKNKSQITTNWTRYRSCQRNQTHKGGSSLHILAMWWHSSTKGRKSCRSVYWGLSGEIFIINDSLFRDLDMLVLFMAMLYHICLNLESFEVREVTVLTHTHHSPPLTPCDVFHLPKIKTYLHVSARSSVRIRQALGSALRQSLWIVSKIAYRDTIHDWYYVFQTTENT